MDDYHLAGGYETLGREYADRLAAAGRSLEDAAPETLDPPPDRRRLARECADHLREHAPFLLAELAGIADATGIDPWRVETVPLALDARAGCSLAVVSGDHTTDGTPLFARNHDIRPSFREFATLYRTEPEDGLASIGSSCVYVGRCDGVNEAGLAIGFAGVPPHEFEPGLTWQLAVRAVLDTCRTVEQGVAFLESIPHASNVNLLLADDSGAVALVEASPERVATRFPDDDFVTVTNQFHTAPMREHQATDWTPADCSRRQALEAWFEEHDRAITAKDLQTAMTDPDHGVCWPVDEQTDDPRSTIWSWTIDPAARVGYLASDKPAEKQAERVAVPAD